MTGRKKDEVVLPNDCFENLNRKYLPALELFGIPPNVQAGLLQLSSQAFGYFKVWLTRRMANKNATGIHSWLAPYRSY